MKKLYIHHILILFLVLVNEISAQTGPAGVGNSSNNIVWLDASQMGLTNNDPVSTWSDISGNGNNVSQGTSSFRPTYLTNQLNSLPVVSFDGTNDRLEFGSNITTGAISTFMVYKRPENSISTILGLSKHMYYTGNGVFVMIYLPTSNRYNINHVNDSFSVFSMHTNGSASGSNLRLRNNVHQASFTRAGLWNNSNSTIGCRKTNGGSYSLFLDGEIAEIIIYNSELNTAQHNIINNHLAAKYNLPIYTDLYVYQTEHGNDVKGLGVEADGSQTTSRGNDSLQISNMSSPNNGDYILVGHDNAGYGNNTNVSSTTSARWDQVWRADITGAPGTVTLEFFLGGNGFGPANNYVVLMDSVDNDFTNGGTKISSTGSYQVSTNSVIFTGVSIPDGAYFTLAQEAADITSDGDGTWSTPATWSCNCIPGESDIVTIESGDNVTLSSSNSVLNLTIESGGTLTFSGTDTLYVLGNLDVDGSISSGNGTLAATQPSGAQTFTNSSGSSLGLSNLYVANSGGLFLSTGTWTLSGSLQVESGGLDVTGVTSITLESDASGSSQILESMSNAFTGDFIIQRYIGPRTSNFGNLSSPITDATVADLDDDLILSGVGGNEGNATVSGGGIFYSVYAYNINSDQHDTLTSLSDDLKPGVGYEVYLATTSSNFSATTVDYVGTPNSGDVSSFDTRVNNGWNLLGNPYHSFLAWDSVEKHVSIGDDYYVYNTDNGSYDFFTGTGKPLLAPGQGFWIFQGGTGARIITYKEEDKGSGTTEAFLRKKEFKNKLFTLKLNHKNSHYNQKFYLKFDPLAERGYDDYDRLLLRSPFKEAPALYSTVEGSDEKLMVNAVNPLEDSHLIPLEMQSGLDGQYSLEVDELDLAFDNYNCIYLKDMQTNQVIDLGFNADYEFNAKANSTSRFNLVFSNSIESCDELLASNYSTIQGINQNFKLRNSFNDWFVDYSLSNNNVPVEIRIYNTAGQLVKEPISTTVSGTGSLPIQGIDQLEGIFLIQVKSLDEFLNKTVKL